MENDEYVQAFSDIANAASKLETLCKLIVDPTDANSKDTQTMFYIIRDYVSKIKETADRMVG